MPGFQTRISDVCQLGDGAHASVTRMMDGVPYLTSKNIGRGVLKLDQMDFISEVDYERLFPPVSKAITRLHPGDVLTGIIGTFSNSYVYKSSDSFGISSAIAILRPDQSLVNPQYLYYYLNTPQLQSLKESMASGSVQGYTNLTVLGSLPLRLPALDDQQAIAEVLGALDDKIAANTKLIALIDSHISLEYAAAVTDASTVAPLGEVAEFHNRKRVPLSSREREQRPGNVPYYGASACFGTVDQAIFDEPLVLVGEDGSVINADGTPVTQYIWGPAWVNNHAHVLTGIRISTELLYFVIARAQVATLVTGAVQPKINMGNLKRLLLELPPADKLGRMEEIVKAETACKRIAVEENATLAATRDALLPQLMSGKLRVRAVESVLEGAGV